MANYTARVEANAPTRPSVSNRMLASIAESVAIAQKEWRAAEIKKCDERIAYDNAVTNGLKASLTFNLNSIAADAIAKSKRATYYELVSSYKSALRDAARQISSSK